MGRYYVEFYEGEIYFKRTVSRTQLDRLRRSPRVSGLRVIREFPALIG